MDNSYSREIGLRIAEIRQKKHLTQAELAEKLCVSTKHISHIECGTSSLSLKNLISLCQLFDCSLDYIIFGEEKNNTTSKLPVQIVRILEQGSEGELRLLNRYLNMYIDLSNEFKK